ncbi:endothelin-converting enzyme 1 [Malassezia sp. CBS 17886]|nr:endothelin-converting enzyme 1 [Malassezia sp. CBS 17886]
MSTERNDASEAHEGASLLDDPEHGVPAHDATPTRDSSCCAPVVRAWAMMRSDAARAASWRVLCVLVAVLVVTNVVDVARRLFTPPPHSAVEIMNRVCTAEDCVKASWSLLRSINTSVDPCDDFYEFATGGWRAQHPIPRSAGLFGVEERVREKNNAVLQKILSETANAHANAHAGASSADDASRAKLRAYYGACLDVDSLNEVGARALLAALRALRSAVPGDRTTPRGRAALLAWLHGGASSALMDVAIGGDPRRAPRAATVHIRPGGLGLPDASYYDDDEAVQKYTTWITDAATALQTLGASLGDGAPPSALAHDIVQFEAALAAITPDAVALSDPEATYNPCSREELAALLPAMDWDVYLHAMSDSVLPHKAIVASTAYLHGLQTLVATTRAEALDAYFAWTLVRDTGLYLGPDVPVAQPVRALHRFARGVALDAPEDRAAVCLNAVTAALGYMSGRFFVQAAFSMDSRDQVEDMVQTIRDTFKRRLPGLPWLDARTAAGAQRKADAVSAQVGYPAEPDTGSGDAVAQWYAALDVAPHDHYANVRAARAFRVRTAWSYMGGDVSTGALGALVPSDVDAAYSAARNEIALPAGRLQPPYFAPRSPMYLQYGALGTTAAHELSLAFGPAGRLYDQDGVLHDWWSPAASAAFDERLRCLEQQYGNYTIRPENSREKHLNSRFTIREDVADAGGLVQSFYAWQHVVEHGDPAVWARNQRLPGFAQYTQTQLFFLAYGAQWARSVRTAEALYRLKTDPHSPAKYRVNGALVNFSPFADAFGCRPGHDAMALRAEDRCEIW